MNAGGKIQYVLDANVMWFFQRQLDEQDNNIRDYVAAAIGVENAASLIRTSIDRLSQKTGRFTMLESHKFETDVAFASQFPQDYDALRRTLSDVVGEIVSKYHTSSNPAELPRTIVQSLKENHQQKFHLLTDILSRSQQKKHEIDGRTHILPVPPYDRVPPDLWRTLKKIGYILREGDNRPTFSVAQDIKALRDVAICNAQERPERTVLLTFDKRLLQAVRLVQSWKDLYSEYIDIENCQTFWVQYLTDTDLTTHSAATSLKEIMEDFRLKSRQFLLPAHLLLLILVPRNSALALMPAYAKNLLPWSVVSRPLEGEAPTIDLAVGYSNSNTSPILKLFLSRIEDLTDRISSEARPMSGPRSAAAPQ